MSSITFQQWITPLLDFYEYEPEIFTQCIRPNKHGTLSVRNAPEVQERLQVSAGYLYKIRVRLEALAILYEVLVL